VRNNTRQNNYIKQVRLLTAGLNQAGKDSNVALLIKYENVIEALLVSLQGKSVSVELRVELNKLKAQHAFTQDKVSVMIESVKKNMEELNIKKKRMTAYAGPATAHINIKA